MDIDKKAYLDKARQRREIHRKHIPPSDWHLVAQEISVYYGENYSYWCRNLPKISSHVIREVFEWVKTLPHSKKSQVKILADQFSKKKNEKN